MSKFPAGWALLLVLSLTACSSLMSSATSGMAANLNSAILNQNDPETVRDGAPAYLLMLDSFVEGAPEDPAMLGAAAELYALYGVVFVDDEERASRLTTRSLEYGERAMCASNQKACNHDGLRFPEFKDRLAMLKPADTGALYTFSLSWFAYIYVHSAEPTALTKLPRAEAALRRVQELDPSYRQADVERYLGVLSTIRPPALGGKFEEGRAHFEKAIELTGGRDLSTQVDFARFYARTLYDRELHDELLNKVLAADPEQEGLTLFNVIAQRDARELLASADDYF